ncbi:MAG: hypothetical protein Q8M44_04925, partial [bacterium]|nr:hypothetical protein [bacterium]
GYLLFLSLFISSSIIIFTNESNLTFGDHHKISLALLFFQYKFIKFIGLLYFSSIFTYFSQLSIQTCLNQISRKLEIVCISQVEKI